MNFITEYKSNNLFVQDENMTENCFYTTFFYTQLHITLPHKKYKKNKLFVTYTQFFSIRTPFCEPRRHPHSHTKPQMYKP